jgi:hypothetical protein
MRNKELTMILITHFHYLVFSAYVYNTRIVAKYLITGSCTLSVWSLSGGQLGEFYILRAINNALMIYDGMSRAQGDDYCPA